MDTVHEGALASAGVRADGTIDINAALRSMLEGLLNAVMDEQASELGVARNGYRERRLDTCVGTVTLRIPKLREGSYFPDDIVQRWSRTDTALASAMEDMELLVFTNSLTVASELAKLEHVMAYLIGGRLNRYSMSTTGARAIEAVRSKSFDQVFLGVTGCQRKEGFSCGSDDEAVFKQTLVERSHECVVLMDSSKEERPSTFKICDLRDVDVVVSDGGLSSEFARACEDRGVTLL